MKNIEKYISDLDWHNPESTQKNAMEKLLKMRDHEVILLAQQSELCNRSCWYNAAIILRDMGYPNNRFAIPYLMRWFQDMDRPEVQTIVELLKEINMEVILPHIKNAAAQAVREHDYLWAYGLVYLLDELDISESDIREQELFDDLIDLANGL